PVAPARRRDEPGGKRGAGRWVAMLLILALAAGVIAYAAGNSAGTDNVKLREIDGSSTGEIVDQMKQLVDDNTK
ncbi:MAG: hypothetical protein M3401_05535, partial [Actinomycetota bacterium]|nr:hypothetical protein [Actinomycetota bacterium]